MSETILQMSDWKSFRFGWIVAPNWLGDAVMCLPALSHLLQQTPDCAWSVLARPAVAPVFTHAGLRAQVLPVPAPASGWRMVKALHASRRSLRQALPRRADVALVLPNSFYSGVLAWMTGAPVRVGYDRDGRGALLTRPIPAPAPGETPAHESFYYLELLRRAGVVAALPATTEARLYPAAGQIEAMSRRLRQGRALQVVALHAGATFGTAKRWLPERFAELAAHLSIRGVQVVLVGSAAERELAAQVCRLAMERRGPSAGAAPEPVNLAGQTSLPEAMALLAAADLLVSNDSGPMHLAGALGTAVVAIFGSTNDRETYPLTQPGQFRMIKAPGIDCSPCKLRECPIDHRCMTRIEVEQVLAAVLEALARPAAS